MRVLAVTSIYPNPLDPGRAPFNRSLYRELGRTHAIRVIAPVAWTDEVRGFVRRRGALPSRRDRSIDGVVASYPRYVYPPGTLRWTYGSCYRWSIARTFSRAVHSFQPDVVLASWAYPDVWAAVQLAHEYALPVVALVHGSDLLCGPRKSDPRVRALTSSGLRSASHVVAVSQHLAREAESLGVASSRISVLYLGIDTKRFTPGSKLASRLRLSLHPSVPLVLFAGRLVPIKGLDILLRALARLVAGGKDLHCVLIGDGAERTALELLAASLGLTRHVTFMGEQPHESLPDWYRAADLFVLPSLSEGTPTVLQEALACDTPFVATRVGGTPELVGTASRALVAPGDVAALEQAIRDGLQSPHGFIGDKRLVRSHADAAQELTELLARIRGDVKESDACLLPGASR